MIETVVYAAQIPDGDISDPLYPPERQAEIDGISREGVKREKYFVWKLLEYAVVSTLGVSIEELSFKKLPSRKWISDKICFSLSHTDGVVAVAISHRPVGVDVEKIRPHREGLERSILTKKELAQLSATAPEDLWEQIIRLWTQKESIFKAGDGEIFEPTKIETAEYSVKTEMLSFDGENFMLSVCAYDAEDAKFEFCKL